MKILMVYPEYPETTFWSFKGALEFTGESAALPPLGLLTVGTMIPREWETVLVDENVERLTSAHILWADIVFVSGMIVQQESAIKVLERCRNLGVRTVLGGPMVTADPERFLNKADTLFFGEAENIFPSLVENLRQGVESVKKEYRSDMFCDIRKSLVPRFGLLGENMRKYTSMAIQVSRGCPYNCEFCDVTILFGKKMRYKTASQVQSELKALYELGWRGTVFMVDDNFIGNPGLAKDILKAIIEFQIAHGYPFGCYTQVDIGLAANDVLIAVMVRAGFFRVFIGIETPETESLKGTNKHHNVNIDIPDSVRRLLRSGIQVQAGFVIGFDQDTEETPQRMIDFIQETGIMTAMVGTLQALPGTVLFHRLVQEGRLLERSTGDNSDGSVGFAPKGMTREQLEEGFKRIISAIYASESYYLRLCRFIDDYHPNSFQKHHFSWGGLRAFVLSIVRIGITSSARAGYWKSLLRAASVRPSVIPSVVEHWIFWFHFNQITRGLVGDKGKPAS